MKTNTPNIARKVFFLFSILFFLNANAQVPNKFSFQAVVRNSSNQLITNQSVGVKISLISVVMGTENAEFEETHTVTTNANGLFSLKVGEGALVSGDFTTAMSSSAQSKKIKCEIDPTGGTNYTIVSNEQLLSVPYALFANTAASTTSNNSWKITGNSNIDPATQFIGTTDDNALQFKVNNEKAGIIETNDGQINFIKNENTAFGYQSLNSNTTGE
jgi:trimeric autotransporter adhesin